MLTIGFASRGYRNQSLKSFLTLLVSDPGNEEAWKEFFHRFDESIHRMVVAALRKYFQAGSENEASDLVQQVYVRLIENDYRALRNFRGTTETDFRAYLARICYNLILDCARVAAATEPLTSAATALDGESFRGGSQPVSAPDQESVLHRHELRGLIDDILTRLGQDVDANRNRMVFLLRHFDGCPSQQVAHLLQISTDRVDSIYYRVRKKVEMELAKVLYKKIS